MTWEFILGWLVLAVIVGISINCTSSHKVGRSPKNALILSIGSLLLSGVIITFISNLSGADPLTDEQYKMNMLMANIKHTTPHTVDDKTITGFVTDINDKVTVTSRLAVKQRPQNEIFYDYKIVDYEIITEADLEIGDEVAISRGHDGVFRYAGKVNSQ